MRKNYEDAPGWRFSHWNRLFPLNHGIIFSGQQIDIQERSCGDIKSPDFVLGHLGLRGESASRLGISEPDTVLGVNHSHVPTQRGGKGRILQLTPKAQLGFGSDLS